MDRGVFDVPRCKSDLHTTCTALYICLRIMYTLSPFDFYYESLCNNDRIVINTRARVIITFGRLVISKIVSYNSAWTRTAYNTSTVYPCLRTAQYNTRYVHLSTKIYSFSYPGRGIRVRNITLYVRL